MLHRRRTILALSLATFALLAMGGCGGGIYAHSGYHTKSRYVHHRHVREVYRYRTPAPCPPPFRGGHHNRHRY